MLKQTFYFSVNGLLKIKEDLTKEREDHLKEIAKLQEAAGNSSEIQSKLESEKNKAEEKIQEVNHFLPPIIQRNKMLILSVPLCIHVHLFVPHPPPNARRSTQSDLMYDLCMVIINKDPMLMLSD
jgi:hypothetical protein